MISKDTKISKDAAFAFENGLNFSRGNTQIRKNPFGGMDMYLHGNLIAHTSQKKLTISSGGFSSLTTRARLNALQGVCVYQKNYQWYLNGQKWDGSPCNPAKKSTIKCKK